MLGRNSIFLSLLLVSYSFLSLASLVDDEEWVGEPRGRSLLQTEEEEEGGEEGVEEGGQKHVSTTQRIETTPFNKENEAGPSEFYFENGKLPKLLMSVDPCIKLKLYQRGELIDTFHLNVSAKGGISGSRQDLEIQDLQLDIDYKGQQFTGIHNGEVITGVQIEMYLEGKPGRSWSLTGLKIVQLGYKREGAQMAGGGMQGDFFEQDLEVVSDHGYKVSAPWGLAWCCQEAGVFHAWSNSTISPALEFPDLKIQAFQVELGQFGPQWECGEILSIGLITGILVTLGFAVVCFWGFSMLANINTMDRFDDPKGPSIYVPNSD